MPFKKIFLATDGSPNAEAGLKLLLSGPWAEDATINVIVVADKPGAFGQLATAEAETLANRVSNQLKDKFAGKSVHAHMLAGNTADSILQLLQTEHADMLVMGAHSRHGLIEELLVGSVADKLIKQAKTSLLIARATANCCMQKILVCLGNADTSQHVINVVESGSWPVNTEFMLFHGFQPPLSEYSPSPKRDLQMFHDAEIKSRAQSVNFVHDYALKLKSFFPQSVVRTSVVEDFFLSTRVIDVCKEWPADLVILGAHGHLGSNKSFAGSDADKVLQQAPCSVLLSTMQPD